jgi:hypothetical protein
MIHPWMGLLALGAWRYMNPVARRLMAQRRSDHLQSRHAKSHFANRVIRMPSRESLNVIRELQ